MPVSLAAAGGWTVPAASPAWNVRCVASRKSTLSLRDTHTWALFFGGSGLGFENGEWIAETAGRLIRDAATPAAARCASDFGDGRMRAFLAEAIGVRALRETARAGLQRELHEILDGSEKVVLRLEVTRLTNPEGPVYITLHPLLGYGADAARMLEILGASGCGPAPETLIGGVYRLLGVQPLAYSAKPPLTFEPGSEAAAAVVEILQGLLEVARWNEFGIAGDVDTEFLHDFRVALRKMRSVLSLTKGVFSGDATTRWKKQLGDVCRKTNVLRDLDVQILGREDLCAMLPEELRPGLDRFFEESGNARAVQARKVAAYLKSKSYTALVETLPREWENPVYRGPAAAHPVGLMASARLQKRFQRIRKLQKSITSETPDSAIHALRIECKKMRYLLDSFGRLFPADCALPIAKSLARVQNRLGRYNDTSVQQDHFLERAHGCLETGDCRMALALGGLIGSLHHEHAALRKKVVEALAAFCNREHRALVKSLIPLDQ